MYRRRILTSLSECVNPIYHQAWGSGVTVKHVIDSCVDDIERIAYRRLSKYGHVRVILPLIDFAYIYSLFARFVGTNITVVIGDGKWYNHDIQVVLVPFSTTRPRYAIPIGWDDNEHDYTWQQVNDNIHTYPSSSTRGFLNM